MRKRSITELIAGKRQGNVVSSLMSNYDVARDALETSLHSEGSATQEHEKWMESLESSVNKVKAAWQSLSQSFLKSDFLKGLLKTVESLTGGLGKLFDTFGTLPTLMGVFAAFKSFKGGGFFRPIIDEASGAAKGISTAFGRAARQSVEALQSINIKNVGNQSSFATTLRSDITALEDYRTAVRGGMSATEAQNQYLSNASDSAKIYAQRYKAATLSTEAFSREQRMGQVSMMAQNKSLGNARTLLKEYRGGCKNAGMSQGDFLIAVKKTNPQLAAQMTSTKSTTGAMFSYAASLVGAKLATFGLRVAVTALNAALTMGISLIVGELISAFMSWINSEEELAEKVEEVTSAYKERYRELQKMKGSYDTSNEDSMISRYEKLSKGVNHLGENVSLTADEYSEYQDIVNTIADQIPSLVSGWDAQGNAILNCKGNVEELTRAYENLIKAENDKVIRNLGNITESLGNKIEDADDADWFGGTLTTNTAQGLEKIVKGDITDYNEILNILNSLDNEWFGNAGYDQILDEFEKRGIKLSKAKKYGATSIHHVAQTISDYMKNDKAQLQDIIDGFYGGFDKEYDQLRASAQALWSNLTELSSSKYYDMNDIFKNAVSQSINNWGYSELTQFADNPKLLKQVIDNTAKFYSSIDEDKVKTIEGGFDLQTKFNGGEISYGEYIQGLQDVESTLDGLVGDDNSGQAVKQLKVNLGVGEGGTIEEYNALLNKLTDSKNYDFNISKEQADNLLSGLSAEEYDVAVDVITEMSDNDVVETVDDIRAAIDREKTLRGLNLELGVEVEKTKLESLSTALGESVSGSGLGRESIDAIEGMFSGLSGYDPSKLFERTANGIRLNSTELKKLNDEYKDINIANVNKEIDSLGNIYNQTRKELYELTYGTDEYNKKSAELSGIEERIKDLEQLSAGYEGLASAFQEWQMAEEAESQRSMYETVLEGLETVGDEISRGWYDDGTVEYLELLTGRTDLAMMSAKELKQVYKGLDKNIKHTSYSIRDFFTVDEDGNSTVDGVKHFLDAIGQMEEEKFGGKDVVKRDKNKNIIGFDFQIVGGNKVIAEALGISEELVEIMVRAADDAGFVVSMDGTYQQLDVLREKAQEASVSLNNILEKNGQKGFDFNFNSSNVDDITKQLTEAKRILDTFRNTDGTINTKLEGADEALTVASTLQSMLDKFSRPTYMNLEVSQVEDELQNPLRKLQELRTLTETEHQLKLSGADTSELQNSIDELYTELDNLPEETKIEIGLVDENKQPLTGDALKNKVNDIVSGKTELGIKATVDIQLEMDKKLDILAHKALLDAGVIDEEEFNKRVKIYLEADVDNKDAKEKTEQAVDNVIKTTKSDVKNAKAEVKTEVDKAKSDAKNAKDSIKSEKDDIKLGVESVKSSVEGVKSESKNIKSEIASAETNIENLSNALKSLQDMAKETSVSVTANLYGNVADMNESEQTDDLLMFAAGVEALKDLPEEKIVSVFANLSGNVPDLNEGEQIDDLLTFAAGVEALKDLPENKSVTIKAQLDGNVPDMNESKQIDDLIMFAEGAKALKEVESKEVVIKAQLDGNVPNMNESKQIDDLLTFADGAKALKEVESKEVTITANLNGNVPDLNEGKQTDDLLTFAKGAKALKDLGLEKDEKIGVAVYAQLDGNVPNLNEGKQIDDLLTFAKGASDLKALGLGEDEKINVSVTANLKGNVPALNESKHTDDLLTFAEGAKALRAIGDEPINVSVTADLDGNVPNMNESKQIDDLLTFADGAKALQDINSKEVVIKADLKGNVPNLNEGKQTDDLLTFANGAKALQDIESKEVVIKAQLDGNVPNLNESKHTDDLLTFANGAKELQSLESKEVVIKAQLDGNVPNMNEGEQIDDLLTFANGAKELQGLESKEVIIKAQLDGNVPNLNEGEQIDDLLTFAEGAKALKDVESKEVTIAANLKGNVPALNESKHTNDLITFATGAKTLQGVESKSVTITANANGTAIEGDGASNRLSSLTEFKSLISGLSNQTVTVTVTANVDSENINKAIDLLKKASESGVFKDYSATVKVGATVATIDDTVVKNYIADEKTAKGKVNWSNNATAVDEFKNKIHEATGKVNWGNNTENVKKEFTAKGKISWSNTSLPDLNGDGDPGWVNGTASGKAFAQGNWGIKGNGVALGGEMGTELVVRNGRWFTIGDEGAEFFRYRKNDIVFNATQTESLFKYGGIKGANPRGKMLASGSAFAGGLAFGGASGGGGYEPPDSSLKPKSKSSKSSSSSSSKSEEKFEEVIDWIETILDRADRAVEKYEKQANNIYKSWTSRNKALESQISEVGNSIKLYEQAKNSYLSEANKVGLDESYAKKVRNGSLNIEDFEGKSDEKLVEKIKKYQEWYEKALDLEKQIEELKETEASLYVQRFENVQAQYDGVLQGYEHTESMLNEYISQAEAKGRIVSKNYYQALINNEKQNINALKQEQAALIAERDKAVADGKITKYSEEWYDMCAEIDGVTQAIEEGTTSLIEYNNAMRDIDWEVFDLIQERISEVTEESDFLIELMSNKKLYDDNGRLTEQGVATMGLHGLNYNTHMYQADEYAKELEKLDRQIASGQLDGSSKAVIDRRNELIGLQRESILAAEDEKNAIRDMVEEGINLELDAMQELIDKKNEALESEKDLYEYQKRVEESTKNISNLRKQLSSVEGDDSEEAKARVQQLKVELEEAETELEETEWDRLIENTQQITDSLYEQYSELLNTRLDNIDDLLGQVIEGINLAAGAEGTLTSALGAEGSLALAVGANATTIGETLTKETDKVGAVLSQAMNNIWNGEGNTKSVLTTYGDGFQNKQSTTNDTLSSIKTEVGKLVTASDKEAEKKVAANKTQPSAKADPTKDNKGNKPVTTPKSKSFSGDGKAKVGDKVKFVSGQYYYDSQGTKPLGYHNRGGYVYITKINEKSWATHPYHIAKDKAGKHPLGWLKLNQLSGYETGKKNFIDNEYAWTQENGQEFIVRPSDGAILTPIAKGDSVLTSAASSNIWDMANSPAEFIKDNLNLGTANVPNNSTTQNLVQNIDNITFSMPNVHSYNELLAEMQKDKSFEKLILSMTIDRIAGKSSLAKGKSVR